MAVRYYPAIVEQAGGNFSAFFPDFDGCVSAGDTVEETAANAEAALAFHIRGMIEDGETIPMPTPLEQLAKDPEVEEFARILVRAELPGKAVRLNITMEEGLLSAVDAAAKSQGKNRSAFLADAVREALRAEREA
jgi:predicted RNase H-like HicB family nuclease